MYLLRLFFNGFLRIVLLPFADATSVLSIEPKNPTALAAKPRLQALVSERNEKLKNDMLGKLVMTMLANMQQLPVLAVQAVYHAECNSRRRWADPIDCASILVFESSP